MKIEERYKGKNNSRVCVVELNSKKMVTPFYFPSITTAETRTDIADAINFITNISYPSILVSCYDLTDLLNANSDVMNKLDGFFQNGGIILLDSGEFEQFHFKGSWPFEKYEEIVKKISSDFFTSFDKTPVKMGQDEIEKYSEEYISKSVEITDKKQCIAICHGEESSTINSTVKKILEKKMNLQIIAVPERECGGTLLDQCKIISNLRETINKYDKKILLHVLGCGNPISISALSYAGADTFDAVDWCRWGINTKTFEYGNIALVKLYNCPCGACQKINVEEEKFRSWEHNLEAYNNFLARLRKAIARNNSLEDFLKSENIDASVISNLAKLF